MTTYKKLNDVITIKFNSSATNVTLSYNGSPLYFGLEDQDGNYEGNLTQTRYDLSTDQTGCSAYTINQQGSTSGTALLIVASITKMIVKIREPLHINIIIYHYLKYYSLDINIFILIEQKYRNYLLIKQFMQQQIQIQVYLIVLLSLLIVLVCLH